jgi:hypothetical protein
VFVDLDDYKNIRTGSSRKESMQSRTSQNQPHTEMEKRGVAGGGLETIFENGLGRAHSKTCVHYPHMEANIYCPNM